ncbi:PREDICTED: organic cation transporter protein-like [Papilio xuthus]|uniref:Organic cation transporter protein-like n=2 Tax=Papilio xuthus TaxID=66420 RepID=A0AAJ6ZJ67_PAPXU|nr:PREDICTED: organic cation transporter protein-like [Papilio xuthus]
MEGECVGGFGRWQVRLATLLALPVLLTGLYGTNYVFLAANTPYRCHISECEDNGTLEAVSPSSWSPDWANFALPADDACSRHPAVSDACDQDSFDNTSSVMCDSFVYLEHRSIVAEFNLACQEGKRALVGTVHNVGMLVSLPIMGYISDKWGRRAALVVSGTGAGLLGLCKSFAGSYTAYILAEFLETVLGASVYPAAFVLMIEWLGVEQRILASLLLGIPLSAGAATLALLDYLTGYWRLWARVAYPPSFLLLLYPWLLPESVRWLVANNKLPQAARVIKQAARWNRVALPEDAIDKMLATQTEPVVDKTEVEDDEEESLFRAFIKYGELRRRLLTCFVWWSSAVFVFYGLAVRAHALAGSPHGNYALLAAAELPALLLNTLLLDRAGRRPLLTAALLLTALALIAIPLLPDSEGVYGTALFLVGKVGATMALNALYVYTAELFPTRARQRLLAACSTCGRLGAILAPLTPLLAAYGTWVPPTLLGVLPLASAALTRLVPETLGRRLPDRFRDLQLPQDSIA